jgi:hypothetical protein
MNRSGIFAWIGLTAGVGAAMAVALDDIAVGLAIGAAIATALTRAARGGNCGAAPRARE